MNGWQTERRTPRARGLKARVVLLPLMAALLSPAGAAPAVRAAATTTADPVIAAAGDIACDPASSNFKAGVGTSGSCRQMYTSDLLVNAGLAAVLPLGDTQYECGGLAAYQGSYDPSWGRVKSITHPAIGNHEYITSSGSGTTGCTSANAGAAGFFTYFGAAGAGVAGKAYYSYDIGTWHIIALNSQCGPGGGCSLGTQQETWLRNDLATHTNFCTLAYWHVPLFSSGGRASSSTLQFWKDLYDANADVVLNGHDHIYERFAPQDPSGALDTARGIREFISGTGGNNHTSIASVARNSEVRDTTTFGVLELTLHATSYDWKFVPAAGSGTFTDSGSAPCHGTQTDTQPPTAPTSLAATAASTSEIDLTWGASTDDTGVSGYRVFRDGVLLTTVTGTSFADTGLVPSTTHTYQVYAVDATGNVSAASNTSQATTFADTEPPTAPTGLTATPAGSTEVDLSWTGSTDNAGVDHYSIVRDGTQVAVTTGTTYADTTVSPSSTYAYSIVAVDVAGNTSAPSNTATATTPAPPTTLTFAPVADTYVETDKATTNFGTSSTLIVDGSPVTETLLKFDVTGIGGRRVLSARLRLYCSNDASSASGVYHAVPDSSWTETGVNWNTAPALDATVLGSIGSTTTSTWADVDVTAAVKGDGTISIGGVSTSANGVHFASRESGAATAPQLVVTTAAGPADTSPPSQPGNLAATGTTDTSVSLGWSAATDDVGVDHYEIDRDGSAVATTAATSYTDTGLTPSTLHAYSVTAVDAAGNRSTAATTTATTAADTTPPGAPTGLGAGSVTVSQAQLSWNASTDDVGIAGYRVYRNGAQIGTTTAASYTDTTVAAAMTYSYTVTALDAAGNESPSSAALAVTTPAAPDTSPPTSPGALAVSGVTDTSVSLGWTASSDDVGVDHYEIDRNGTAVGTTASTSYTDTGLAPSTTYHDSVIAVDGAGNRSAAAAVDGTTAADTVAPTAPSGVAATSTTAAQVVLAWNAASDDIGVTGYRVYRDGTQIGTTGSTGYTDTGILAGTGYAYTVTALDAAGNESPPSTALQVNTPAEGATLFEDGFESGTLNAWTNVNGLTVQPALVFDGGWAARATSTGTPTYAYGHLSSTASTVTYSLDFLIASQGANNVNLLRFRTASGGSLGAVYVTSSDRLALRNDVANVSTTSTTTVTQGVWHELTVQFTVGDATGSSESITFDGAPALSRTDTLGTSPVGIVQLGESQSSRTYDIAYDDVQVTSP